ncbi:hypothetical protein BGX38DRAFT_1138695 [Terfezia claveryi]|nr:hypothetical protein BGX38DRAFT_1138695 [Terfezia claveryi]
MSELAKTRGSKRPELPDKYGNEVSKEAYEGQKSKTRQARKSNIQRGSRKVPLPEKLGRRRLCITGSARKRPDREVRMEEDCVFTGTGKKKNPDHASLDKIHDFKSYTRDKSEKTSTEMKFPERVREARRVRQAQLNWLYGSGGIAVDMAGYMAVGIAVYMAVGIAVYR